MSEMQEARETKIAEGRYLYCIVNCNNELSLGKIGIDGAKVCTVPYKDIAVVVHACSAKPYETKDDEKAKRWIFTHNYVIDKATKRFGTVLPLSFDVIIKGNDDTVKDALSKGYDKLKGELERVKGRAEYTVQIFCDPEKLTEKILSEDQELKELEEKIEKMPKGATYLLQRKLELKTKDMISAGISRLAEEFSSKMREHIEEMKVEETSRVPEKYRGNKLIVTLACFVSNEKVEGLGRVLEEINNREGYAVRFTGPWAPFSFIKLKEIYER
jgi:hypothetical protein